MRFSSLAFVLSACWLCSASLEAGEGPPSSPPEVGRLSKPANVVFKGARVFSPQTIKDELFTHVDFVLAAHPRAPRARYLLAIRKHILAGYHNCGFPEIGVRVSVKHVEGDSKAIVTITEGPRFLNGKISVVGAHKIDPAKLIAWFTASQSRKSSSWDWEVGQDSPTHRQRKEVDPPLWEPRAPVAFGAEGLKKLRQGVNQAFQHLGYYSAKAEVALLKQKADNTADLLITVKQEGEQAKIGKIVITGLLKNSKGDVLKLLGVKPGQKVTGDDTRRMERQLWLSARFLKHIASVETSENPGQGATLKLDLLEFDEAPKLTEKFAPKDQVLLRTAKWLGAISAGKMDLVVTLTPRQKSKLPQARAILSLQNKGGIYLEWGQPQLSGQPGKREAMLLQGGTLQMASLLPGDKGHKCVVKNNLDFKFHLNVRPNENSAKSREKFEMTFGGNVNPWNGRGEPGTFDGQIELSPVAFLGLARGKLGKITLTDKDLIGHDQEFGLRFRIDRASGKILELKFHLDALNTCKIAFKPGALAAHTKSFSEQTARLPAVGNEQKPLSSFIGFAIRHLSVLEHLSLFDHGTVKQKARANEVIANLFSAQVLAFLDMKPQDLARIKDPFTIPVDTKKLKTEKAAGGLLAMYTRGCLALASQLFAEDVWPLVLAREASMVVAGKGAYTGAELKRLFNSKKMGPLGSLVTAKLLQFVQPKLGQQFARRGLAQIDRVEWLMVDVLALLPPDTPLGDCTQATVSKLAALSKEEIEMLVTVMAPADGQILRECWSALRTPAEDPPSKRFRKAIEILWAMRFKASVTAELKKIASQLEK
jgi:hypothetical protein